MDRPNRPDVLTNPRRAIANDRDRELLGDLVQSPGWEIFEREIVARHGAARREAAIAQVRSGDLAKAQACLASSEAGIEILVGAYEGAGLQVPKEVHALVQTPLFAQGLKDALHERGPGEPASD